MGCDRASRGRSPLNFRLFSTFPGLAHARPRGKGAGGTQHLTQPRVPSLLSAVGGVFGAGVTRPPKQRGVGRESCPVLKLTPMPRNPHEVRGGRQGGGKGWHATRTRVRRHSQRVLTSRR